MRKLHKFLAAGLGGLAAFASSAAFAEVTARTDAGFVVRVTGEVAASPAEAWQAFTTPSKWWHAQHTYSGDAANLVMDPIANGCFCEKLPVPKGAPASQKAGSVMHMRVVYAEPYRALRLVGGLGPLQSEAVNGTMTVTFKSVDGSGGKATRILWEYVVGGFMRYKTEAISTAVDKVLGEQIAGLTRLLGPASPSAALLSPVLPENGAEPESVVAGNAGSVENADPAEVGPSYTPDPTKDDAAAGESVKSALDGLFKKIDARLPPGR
ncbi:hypothetical protein [Novosphingobium sp. B1]|uniref:SRPBCC family protein n=1 Tax=Novosphingobium sp. B1 TaxID=1938756 RepID=UPI0009D79CDC|nr:hypothetical protein [Novosphingobium sp. B1]SMC66977.1 Uncharacterized conserved protein YndB, AHSA1/START domain [Novosphingobium sp. B1]